MLWLCSEMLSYGSIPAAYAEILNRKDADKSVPFLKALGGKEKLLSDCSKVAGYKLKEFSESILIMGSGMTSASAR